LSWRRIADWAKHRPLTLRIADGLGRGRGRMRLLDHLNPPPRPRHKPLLRDWASHKLAAAWIGHATVLLRIGGKTILTDPVLSHRIGVGFGLFTVGLKREFAAALRPRELPPIDLILISHAHMDHLDRPTLARLKKTIPVVTASKTSDLIGDLGFHWVTELGWGDSMRFGDVNITACEVKHWGARMFNDRYRGYNGYVLDDGRHRVLYGGDTADHDFRNITSVDLAILGIGAYDPYIAAHATPEQAWSMARQIGARWLLPIHHSTFRLSHEPMDEPMRRMVAAAGDEHKRLIIREIGGEWSGEERSDE
jgi:L-ascorbate metabolism protein UlaG (beta-lactamase superfamily)